MDCSVVIVNFRSEVYLAECLASLEADSSNKEVLVLDNSATIAPSDLQARFSWVQFITNERNLGFAGASNRGLRVARGRHLLLLNPDTVVAPGAIRTLNEYLDSRPEVGAVGARLLDSDGRLQYSCRRFPGLLTIFFGRYSVLTRLFPRNPVSSRYLYLDLDHAAPAEVDWLSGACLMVKREILESVGPLDEGYPLFVEDMDWCRRMRDAGWKIVYVPTAEVRHHVGVSRGPVPAAIVWARHRGMLRYVRKHFGLGWPMRVLVGAGLALRAGLLMLANSLRGGYGSLRGAP